MERIGHKMQPAGQGYVCMCRGGKRYRRHRRDIGDFCETLRKLSPVWKRSQHRSGNYFQINFLFWISVLIQIDSRLVKPKMSGRIDVLQPWKLRTKEQPKDKHQNDQEAVRCLSRWNHYSTNGFERWGLLTEDCPLESASSSSFDEETATAGFIESRYFILESWA